MHQFYSNSYPHKGPHGQMSGLDPSGQQALVKWGGDDLPAAGGPFLMSLDVPWF